MNCQWPTGIAKSGRLHVIYTKLIVGRLTMCKILTHRNSLLMMFDNRKTMICWFVYMFFWCFSDSFNNVCVLVIINKTWVNRTRSSRTYKRTTRLLAFSFFYIRALRIHMTETTTHTWKNTVSHNKKGWIWNTTRVHLGHKHNTKQQIVQANINKHRNNLKNEFQKNNGFETHTIMKSTKTKRFLNNNTILDLKNNTTRDPFLACQPIFWHAKANFLACQTKLAEVSSEVSRS